MSSGCPCGQIIRNTISEKQYDFFNELDTYAEMKGLTPARS